MVTLKFLNENASAASEQAITELNFGNIIRGNNKQLGFKIGNTGDSTAESVTLEIEGGEAAAWKTISIDNGSRWETNPTLPNITPNGITKKILIKSTVPSIAQTGSFTTTLRCSYIYI